MLVGVVVGVVKVVSITDVSVVGSPIPRNTKVVRPSRIYKNFCDFHKSIVRYLS